LRRRETSEASIGYFIKGLFDFVPVALTVVLIVVVIRKFDDVLNLQVPGLGLVLQWH